MIKNKTVIEERFGERTYQLVCDSDSPLGELYDALYQMQSFVVGKINESQKKPEDAPKEQ